jgi:hypothetical protein
VRPIIVCCTVFAACGGEPCDPAETCRPAPGPWRVMIFPEISCNRNGSIGWCDLPDQAECGDNLVELRTTQDGLVKVQVHVCDLELVGMQAWVEGLPSRSYPPAYRDPDCGAQPIVARKP